VYFVLNDMLDVGKRELGSAAVENLIGVNSGQEGTLRHEMSPNTPMASSSWPLALP
jgi:hypothetical protein